MMPRPFFDIDDLSFFRFYGLGLRHVGIEQGRQEAAHGATRGDAVSLANFGYTREFFSEDYEEYEFTENTCSIFQQKVEAFILQSYCFHSSGNQFKDAAFLLLSRGSDAQRPYDYNSYPLGKCGSDGFQASQVKLIITSEAFMNDDLNHAAYNTILELKNRLLQYKIQQLLDIQARIPSGMMEEVREIIQTIISHYQNGIFIYTTLFPKIEKLINSTSDYDINISALRNLLAKVNSQDKKGEMPISITYQQTNMDAMNERELKQKLIHYINNQNLAKVAACLARLKRGVFSIEEENPLLAAAPCRSTAILQAVYDYDPNLYDMLQANEAITTPIFLAGKYGRLSNLQYLLSIKKLTSRDITHQTEHILTRSACSQGEEPLHVLHFLINQGININTHIGYDFTGIYHNPLANCASSPNAENEKKLACLLPLADYRSKYCAILSTTNELYFSYGYSKRKFLDYADKKEPESYERMQGLFRSRRAILNSLTQEECAEIRKLHTTHLYEVCHANEILEDDLLNFEIHQVKGLQNNVAANIIRCFSSQPESMLSSSLFTQFAPINTAMANSRKEEVQHVICEPTIPMEALMSASRDNIVDSSVYGGLPANLRKVEMGPPFMQEILRNGIIGALIAILGVAAFSIISFVGAPFVLTVLVNAWFAGSAVYLSGLSYGIINDLIGVSKNLPYFSLGHQPQQKALIQSNDRVAVGIAWGIFATMGLSLIAGVIFTAATLITGFIGLPFASFVLPMLVIALPIALTVAHLYSWYKEKQRERNEPDTHELQGMKNAIDGNYSGLNAYQNNRLKYWLKDTKDVNSWLGNSDRNVFGYLSMPLLGAAGLVGMITCSTANILLPAAFSVFPAVGVGVLLAVGVATACIYLSVYHKKTVNNGYKLDHDDEPQESLSGESTHHKVLRLAPGFTAEEKQGAVLASRPPTPTAMDTAKGIQRPVSLQFVPAAAGANDGHIDGVGAVLRLSR